MFPELNALLGPIYTERQRQRCDDACDTALVEMNGNKQSRSRMGVNGPSVLREMDHIEVNS